MKIARSYIVFLAALAAASALISCGTDDTQGHALDLTEADSEHAEMTPSLRAAFVHARQLEAGPSYAVRAHGASLVAGNRAHGFDVAFVEGGVTLQPTTGQSWDLTLNLVSVARPDRGSHRLSAALQQPNALSAGNELRYQRPGGVTEWYLNGPLGLEQGFDLAERPAGEGDQLVIAVHVGGTLSPRLAGSGQIHLVDGLGRVRLAYRDLFAVDATGRELLAHMAVVGDRIELRIHDAGARYPLIIDPLVVGQQAKLVASDAAGGDDFGHSVAVSGDTAVVGAHRDNHAGLGNGSAYVFVRSGSTWNQQAKLVAVADDSFGFSVAVSGDTAVVGSYRDFNHGTYGGSAYVFVRSSSTWSQQAKLVASEAARSEQFGYSVAVSGDTAIIGANGNNDAGASSGSAYVFVRSGQAWDQQAKLVASDAASLANFGVSVAVAGDTAVVGADGTGVASGSAYVFVPSGSTWSQQAKLVASDPASYDRFGVSVAVSGDGNRALIGADQRCILGPCSNSGSAYVFLRSGSTWGQQAKLVASVAGDEFGVSVALSGDTAVVGAHLADDAGSASGSAYVFLLLRCGDGIVSGPEACDDGNETGGDGCSSTCTVEAGYMCVGTNPSVCTNIDECTLGTDNCDDNATCTDTVGSFTCACNAGFTGDGVACTDIDECSLATDNCDANATCTNTPGGSNCACNAGYSGDGTSCTEDDECALGTDNCDNNATCTDTVGSFTCACNAGFTGDGVTCRANSDGGCSCRVGGSTGPTSGTWLFALLAVPFLGRRRQSRHRR